MNSLTDPALIQALYEASCTGVLIDLIIRGVCVLRPGVRGVSENIRVVSVIDKIFLGSADFMPRNMDRRVEVVWPVRDEQLKVKVVDVLSHCLRDNLKSHVMRSDGSYLQNSPGRSKPFRSQERLIDFARLENSQPGRLRDALRILENAAHKIDSLENETLRKVK